MRVNLTKRRKKKWPKNLEKKPKFETKKKKKVFAKARPEIFSNLFTFNKNTPLQKNCTVFFLATGIMILKHKDLHHHACFFFSFAITRCFAKHFKYYYKYSLKLSIL